MAKKAKGAVGGAIAWLGDHLWVVALVVGVVLGAWVF